MKDNAIISVKEFSFSKTIMQESTMDSVEQNE